MLAAFVMIMIGALIIWITTETWAIMLRLWLRIGYQLFQFTVIHLDDDSGDCYGLTFTNDELWQDKMLKDLKEIAGKQDLREGE